ncbi:unnamed protein product [Boreogadus saida]
MWREGGQDHRVARAFRAELFEGITGKDEHISLTLSSLSVYADAVSLTHFRQHSSDALQRNPSSCDSSKEGVNSIGNLFIKPQLFAVYTVPARIIFTKTKKGD